MIHVLHYYTMLWALFAVQLLYLFEQALFQEILQFI